jgi:hypothetical protein
VPVDWDGAVGAKEVAAKAAPGMIRKAYVVRWRAVYRGI